MESKECIVCGKEFIKKVNRSQERWKAQKYCSVKCMGKKISKACLICGKHFLQFPSVGKKYCSKQCSDKSKIKQSKTKICLACGKEFNRNTKRGSDSSFQSWQKRKFCTMKCRRFRYHPIIQAEFWREVTDGYNIVKWRNGNLEIDIPKEIIPFGIMNPAAFSRIKWTEKETKKFREWNQGKGVM